MLCFCTYFSLKALWILLTGRARILLAPRRRIP